MGMSVKTTQESCTVKALSVRQPMAWALIWGGKPVENRTWSTSYRGPLAIHAGKQWDDAYAGNEGKLALWHWMKHVGVIQCWTDAVLLGRYDRGGVIGTVTLVDCVQAHPSPWFCGPWGFVCEDPKPLPFHPCPGRLGIFEADIPGA